jgi:hypothetical protein
VKWGTATKTEQLVVMCRRGVDAHYLVLRIAGRALERGGLWHGRCGLFLSRLIGLGLQGRQFYDHARHVLGGYLGEVRLGQFSQFGQRVLSRLNHDRNGAFFDLGVYPVRHGPIMHVDFKTSHCQLKWLRGYGMLE